MSRFSFDTFERDGFHAYWHAAYEDRQEDQVYLDLIWGLTDGLTRYAIPRYHRDAGVTGFRSGPARLPEPSRTPRIVLRRPSLRSRARSSVG